MAMSGLVSASVLLQRRCAAVALAACRPKSSTATGAWALVEKVALAPDGRSFVAWHPQPEFPYEQSRPLPAVELRDRSTVIKDSAIADSMQAFHTQHPEIAREQLARITFTTKHRWFPRARDKKAKKTPMQREYL